jgi:histidine triad (HIT) family protein
MREGLMVDATMKNCVFCAMVEEKAPCYKIYEDNLSFAILDINPFSKGHCLVLPKRHVPWWHDLTEAENVSLFSMAKKVADQLMRVLKPDFVCMYARGRRIPHTHVFLVPTYSGDVLDKFFNALEVFQESPPALTTLRDRGSMEQIAEKLRFVDNPSQR